MMLSNEIPNIYLYRQYVDFRKSINGLTLLVESELNLPVLSGALFIFCNKSQDKLKILYWDKTGFALWYKRLDRDKFKWPKKEKENALNLTEEQFKWLLSGHSIIGHKPLFDTNKYCY